MDKMHWYSFSYIDGGGYSSTYTGYDSYGITIKMISENKANAHVTKRAVLLSVCYLGFMTRSDFTGEDIKANPSA